MATNLAIDPELLNNPSCVLYRVSAYSRGHLPWERGHLARWVTLGRAGSPRSQEKKARVRTREPVALHKWQLGLLNKALEIGGEKTKKATVNRALREFIARREQERLLELFGKFDWDDKYDYKRQRTRQWRCLWTPACKRWSRTNTALRVRVTGRISIRMTQHQMALTVSDKDGIPLVVPDRRSTRPEQLALGGHAQARPQRHLCLGRKGEV